ncbi:hypothetical protein ACJX0J_022106, partial [Zea mays]
DIKRREEALKNGADPHLFLHNCCLSSTNCISWEIINKPARHKQHLDPLLDQMTTVSRRTVATHLAGVSSSSSVSNATFALLLQSLLTRMISTDFHKECRHLRSHPLL